MHRENKLKGQICLACRYLPWPTLFFAKSKVTSPICYYSYINLFNVEGSFIQFKTLLNVNACCIFCLNNNFKLNTKKSINVNHS